MGMILRIASSRIVGQGDIVGRSGYFSLNLSANSVMRGRLDARRTLKSLVADLRPTLKLLSSVPINSHFLRSNGTSKKRSHFCRACMPTSVSLASYQFPMLSGKMTFTPIIRI